MAIPGVPFKLDARDVGATDLAGAIAEGLKLPYAGYGEKASADYKRAMADYLMSPGGQGRGLSPLGKTINEKLYYQNKNGSPSSSVQSQPDENSTGDERTDEYNKKILQMTTDAQARQRNLYATNIDKTINRINPEHLIQYSGIAGKGKLLADKIQAGLGHPSNEYQNYKTTLNDAEVLASQIRQFYGDSIQPTMIARLEKITNPSSWDNDPETAKKVFNETVNILKNETKTYRDAMKNTKVYQGEESNNADRGYDHTKMTDEELDAKIKALENG